MRQSIVTHNSHADRGNYFVIVIGQIVTDPSNSVLVTITHTVWIAVNCGPIIDTKKSQRKEQKTAT